MFSIEFDSVSRPSGPLQRGSDLKYGVDANFRIADAYGVIFEEPLFGIVELRSALEAWLAAGADTAFRFASVEADEDPLIYFRPTEREWEIGSPWSARSGTATGDELIAASRAFIADVDTWVRGHLAIDDIDDYLLG